MMKEVKILEAAHYSEHFINSFDRIIQTNDYTQIV